MSRLRLLVVALFAFVAVVPANAGVARTGAKVVGFTVKEGYRGAKASPKVAAKSAKKAAKVAAKVAY